jgi:error-prone DNA polymerase
MAPPALHGGNIQSAPKVKGTWQRDGDMRNVIAGDVEDLMALLGGLATSSREFR